MSAPSVLRTVARIPLSSRAFANFATACLPDDEKPVSCTGFTGMRLTWIGKLSFLSGRSALLSRSASFCAAATESFLFAISVYSNEIRLPVL